MPSTNSKTQLDSNYFSNLYRHETRYICNLSVDFLKQIKNNKILNMEHTVFNVKKNNHFEKYLTLLKRTVST